MKELRFYNFNKYKLKKLDEYIKELEATIKEYQRRYGYLNNQNDTETGIEKSGTLIDALEKTTEDLLQDIYSSGILQMPIGEAFKLEQKIRSHHQIFKQLINEHKEGKRCL